MIEGYTFNESGWVKITVPFPNVIYDRLPNRKVENSDYFQSAKKTYLCAQFRFSTQAFSTNGISIIFYPKMKQ